MPNNPKMRIFTQKKANYFANFALRMDHSRQSVLNAHCIGDTHEKQKEQAVQTGQIKGSLFTTLPVPNEARLDDSQLRFYDDSVPEIINTMSETFTTGEKKQFKERVTAFSQKANAKFGKYFDEDCGLHPARTFIYEAQFLNPKTALKFHVRPELNAIPGFSGIPDSEFSGDRLLCREYSIPSGNEFTLEDLRTEAQSIKDFWDGSGANLPVLSKIGRTYRFLVGSSSCVERIFTYYNKVLSPGRASLKSETINLCFCIVVVI